MENTTRLIEKESLRTFTEYFFKEFETKLTLYLNVLEDLEQKSGTVADVIKVGIQGVGAVLFGAVGYAVGGPSTAGGAASAGVTGGGVIGGWLGSRTGARKHKQKAAKLSDTVYHYKDRENHAGIRELLVEASFQIFQSFEAQFMKATVDNGGHRRALMKLARDAVHRVMNHLTTEAGPLSVEVIVAGVIEGRSKEGTLSKFTPDVLPRLGSRGPKPGRTVKDAVSCRTWNTSELYDETGLAVRSGETYVLYRKRGKSAKTQVYGHRLLLPAENWEDLKKEFEKDSITWSADTMHQYAVTSEDLEQLHDIFRYVDDKNPSELVTDLLNEITNEISELIKAQETIQTTNKVEEIIKVMNIISNQLLIQNGQEEIKRSLEEAGRDRDRKHSEVMEAISPLCDRLDRSFSLLSSESEPCLEPIFDVLPPVYSFVGREEELTELHQKMLTRASGKTKENIVVVTGLWGVGKTELAKKYAKEYHTEYDGNVVWIHAENKITLRKSFFKLANILNTDVEKSIVCMDSGRLQKAIYKRLALNKCLLIFDNTAEYRDIHDFLPKRQPDDNDSNLYILITSRNRKLFDEQIYGRVENLDLDVLPNDVAENFVRKSLSLTATEPKQNVANGEDVTELVSILGRLPLALQLAISYIKQSGYSIETYLSLCKNSTEELKSLLNDTLSDIYGRTIFKTFQITLEKIDTLRTDASYFAKEILNVMAFLSPDNIGSDLFVNLARDFITNEIDERVIEDRAVGLLNRSVQLLVQYSVVNENHGTLSIHRLVQEVSRLNQQSLRMEEDVLETCLQLLNNLDAPFENSNHATFVWKYASEHERFLKKDYLRFEYGVEKSSPLHLLAAGRDNAIAIETLLQHMEPKDLNSRDCFGRTALYVAAENSCYDNVTVLVDRGADVNITCDITYGLRTERKSSGWTPLFIAAMNGDVDVIRYLVSQGSASVDVRDSIDRTPAVVAAHMGHVGVVEFLTTVQKRDRNKLLFHAMCSTAKDDDLDSLKDFIEDLRAAGQLDSIVNSKLGDVLPLHVAASEGCSSLVKLLLAHGARVKETTPTYTPLHYAASKGRLKVVKLLIENGADPKDPNKDGYTPLHCACQKGCLSVVKYFLCDLQEKIDVNLCDSKDTTPIEAAAFHGHLHVVKFLIKQGANVNSYNTYGCTPLFAACINNQTDVIKYLLEQKKTRLHCDFEKVVGMLHINPMHAMALFDNVQIARILLEKCESIVTAGENYTISPLHIAAFLNSQNMIALLLDNGANRDAVVNPKNCLMVLRFCRQYLKQNFGSNFLGYFIDSLHFLCHRLPGINRMISSRLTPEMISAVFDYNNQLRRQNEGLCFKFVKVFLSLLLSYPRVKIPLTSTKDFFNMRKRGRTTLLHRDVNNIGGDLFAREQ